MPENYRGISLINVFSKIFTGVLNKRLQTWASDDFFYFRRASRFSRRVCHRRQRIYFTFSYYKLSRQKKRKIYVVFIDYKKVFDSINRNAQWKILEQNDIDGKILAFLKSLYK